MSKEKNKKSSLRGSPSEYLTYIAASGGDSENVEILYDVTIPAINQHIQTIFTDNELTPDSVIKEYLTTAADSKNYKTKQYNLQLIIAVGFKITNERAVRFRKWAGQIVKDYTIQGWTMDVERLKKGHLFTDHRHTAAELIVERANSDTPDMGLTTWDGSPDQKIITADVSITKNYLERIVSMYLDYAELQSEAPKYYLALAKFLMNSQNCIQKPNMKSIA